MTNNTIPNVPRQLLADLLGNDHDKRIMAERHVLAMLANAPSPAGVDGLEVVAWQLGCQTMTGEIGWKLSWNQSGAGVCARLKGDEYEQPLCRLSDATSIIDGLRGEVAQLQSMLATVSKAGIRIRTERDKQAQRIGELEGLLRDCYPGCGLTARQTQSIRERIDAALAAGKEGE